MPDPGAGRNYDLTELNYEDYYYYRLTSSFAY